MLYTIYYILYTILYDTIRYQASGGQTCAMLQRLQKLMPLGLWSLARRSYGPWLLLQALPFWLLEGDIDRASSKGDIDIDVEWFLNGKCSFS